MSAIFEGITNPRPVFCLVVRHGEALSNIDGFREFPRDPRDRQYENWIAGREYKTAMEWLHRHEMPYYVFRLDTAELLDGASRETVCTSAGPLLLVGGIIDVERARKLINMPIYNDRLSETIVDWWPSYLAREFRDAYLRREVMTTTLGELVNNLKVLGTHFESNGRVFVKTLLKQRKGFALVTPAQPSETEITVWDWARVLPPHEPCILSEVIAIAPRSEYRCFIIDNAVASVSRRIEEEFEDQVQEYDQFAQHIANEMDARFPRSYVVDIAKTRNGDMLITEFNAIGTTGRFVNNRIDLIVDRLYGSHCSVSQAEYEAFQLSVDDG